MQPTNVYGAPDVCQSVLSLKVQIPGPLCTLCLWFTKTLNRWQPPLNAPGVLDEEDTQTPIGPWHWGALNYTVISSFSPSFLLPVGNILRILKMPEAIGHGQFELGITNQYARPTHSHPQKARRKKERKIRWKWKFPDLVKSTSLLSLG